jgi:UDP-N-acetylmuramate dehydrogenase
MAGVSPGVKMLNEREFQFIQSRKGISVTMPKRKEIFDRGIFKGEIKFDEPLSAHTSLKIGGPADIMIFPEDVVSLKHVLVTASREMIPVFVLGAGTNLLVKDGGIDGIVVSLKAFRNVEVIRNIERIAPHCIPKDKLEASVALYVESGKPLGGLIDFVSRNGLSGIEPLAGIPGTFGGALSMNAGSFGTEIKDVVISVAFMNMNGDIVIVEKDRLKFSYRELHVPDDAVIISGNIVLKKSSPESVVRHVKDFLKKKQQKQPLRESSAGCVFKNPAGEAAGRLIDNAGCKGMNVGDAEVSTIHANYFINRGGASAGDFLNLMETVNKKVREISGVVLEPEIKIVGREE